MGEYDLVAILIVVLSLILGVTSVWNDSPIIDEIPHIGAGYSYVDTGDHRLNPEHPPLAKDLAGLSLKIAGIQDAPAYESRYWQTDINGQWEFGRKLIFGSGNDAIRLVRFAKIPELIWFVLCAVLIFIWTRKLYGYLAALIALFLFSFSSTVIAHSRYVTTDVPSLFGILMGTYFFLHYLENRTNKNLWIAGAVFGVAQLTKYNVFLLIPFLFVIGVLYVFVHSPKFSFGKILRVIRDSAFIFAIGYIFVVWPVYVLHTWNYPPERQKADTVYLLGSYGNRLIPDRVIELSDKPIIRGLAHYATGLLMVTQRSIGGNTTYFLGEIRNWAWPHYFPVVYFLKEPLAFWGLILLVLAGCVKKFRFSHLRYINTVAWCKNNFTEFTMLLWLGLYWYVSIRSNLNIGVRHMMPVYGFTFILLAGALIRVCGVLNSKKLLATYYMILATLFGWYLYENFSVYPYYLTYFNQVAGGPSGGYRYVVDSNLDWGQDLKRFADWIDENNIKNVAFDYFGWADQTYYLGNNFRWIRAGYYNSAQEFLFDYPKGGYIAVSASFYMGSREKPETSYAWLDRYAPVKVVGNSIFVWYINPSFR